MKKEKSESVFYQCPELDIHDNNRFPPVTEAEFGKMESEIDADQAWIYVYFFLQENTDGEKYVEIYLWDCLLSSGNPIRFVICDGYRLPPDLEKSYLEYARKTLGLTILMTDMKSLSKQIAKAFPQWHFLYTNKSELGMAMEHLYYASHRSGCREILYKAELCYIGYYLDKIGDFNREGTVPQKIIGHKVTLPMLRVLNAPILVSCLFDEEKLATFRKVYRLHGNRIRNKKPTIGQWKYLEALTCGYGMFAGKQFSRVLYTKLSTDYKGEHIESYKRYSDLIAQLKLVPYQNEIGFPCFEAIPRVVQMMEWCFDGTDRRTDESIKKRSEQEKENYCYNGKQYKIIMPQSSIDFCKEALVLHNCLMDYRYPHANRDLTILFLHKKEEPEKPFVAIEISNWVIRHVYKDKNIYPDREVFRFLEEYAREKWLLFDPFVVLLWNGEVYEEIDYCYEMYAYDEEELRDELKGYLQDYRRRTGRSAAPADEDRQFYIQMSVDDLCIVD